MIFCFSAFFNGVLKSTAICNEVDLNNPRRIIDDYTGWNYISKIDIVNPSPLPDYQLKIELNELFFNYSKTSSNGEDIRFMDNNNVSLSYYIEDWNSFGTSLIWVKTETASTPFIYMIYGNPSAVSESNGEDTFDYFDDFDEASLNTTKWSIETDSYSSYSTSLGYLHLIADTPSDYISMAALGFSDVDILHGQDYGSPSENTVAIGLDEDRSAYTEKDDARTETLYYQPNEEWFTNEIRWYNSSNVEFENGTNVVVHTTNIPTTSQKLVMWARSIYAGPGTHYGVLIRSHDNIGTEGYALRSHSWHYNALDRSYPNEPAELKVDWIFMRKLTETEPTIIFNADTDYVPPDDPIDPTDPTEPTEPTDPTEPTEPTEPEIVSGFLIATTIVVLVSVVVLYKLLKKKKG